VLKCPYRYVIKFEFKLRRLVTFWLLGCEYTISSAPQDYTSVTSPMSATC